MGINVRRQVLPKSVRVTATAVTTRRTGMEQDLKDCMRCRFFYDNRRGCLAKSCVREKRKEPIEKPDASKPDRRQECEGCPYRQSERYCFPCMKKLLKPQRKETKKHIAQEQEEEDGETN